MGFLDQLSDRAFRRSKDGQRLFFPWGTFGRGYFVPFAEDEQRIKRESSILLAVCLPFGFLMIILHGNLLVVGGLFVVLAILTFFGPLYLKRGLEPSTERLSFKEEFKQNSSLVPRWFVWCAVIFGYAGAVFFLVMGILRPRLWLEAGILILVFGLLGTLYLRILLIRRNAL